jgi:hypothetical protein
LPVLIDSVDLSQPGTQNAYSGGGGCSGGKRLSIALNNAFGTTSELEELPFAGLSGRRP